MVTNAYRRRRGGRRDVLHRLHLLRAARLDESPPARSTDAQAAAIQQALAANLPKTGTYRRPERRHAAARRPVMYGQGPIATDPLQHERLFAGDGHEALGDRLPLRLLIALLIWHARCSRTRAASGLRIAAGSRSLIAVACAAFNYLGEPIY